MKKEMLKRVFVMEDGKNKVTLADPNRHMTPDQVLQFYSNTYPQLTNSAVHGPQYKGDTITYQFKTTVGTKG